jgi:hypothetical protein
MERRSPGTFVAATQDCRQVIANMHDSDTGRPSFIEDRIKR